MIHSHKNPVLTDYRTARDEGYVSTPLDWYEIASSDMSSGANPGWHPAYTRQSENILTRIQNVRNLHLLEQATQAVENNNDVAYWHEPNSRGKMLLARIARHEHSAPDVWCVIVRPGKPDATLRLDDVFVHPVNS